MAQAGRNLRGQELVDAARRQQNWDPSVQALVAFPDVLSMLTRDIRWTRALGDAFLAQQADVMSAIQTMRASARANGRLQSTPQQNVTVERDSYFDDQQAIDIQPTNPDVMYPPNYDPNYVWGPSPVGAYPDLLYPDYGYGYYPPVYLNSYFGGYGPYYGWGWGFNWFGGGLYVNYRFFDHYGYHGYRGYGNGWAHDPGHRMGVPYSNRTLTSRFGNGSYAARDSNFAGRTGNFSSGASQGLANQRSQNGFRSFSNNSGQSGAPQSGAQGFRSFSNSAPQSRAAQTNRGLSSPAPQQQRGTQSFRAMPQQSFSRGAAPQQNFSAPRPAPQFSGGGNRGGGGGAAPHASGGGGAVHSGGGGGGHHR